MRFARAFWFSPGVPLILLNELVQMYKLSRAKALCQEAVEGALAVSTLLLQSSRAEDVAEDMLRSNFPVYMVPLLKCESVPGEVRRRLLETVAICLGAEEGAGRRAGRGPVARGPAGYGLPPTPARGRLSSKAACLAQLANVGLAGAVGRYLFPGAPEGCGPIALSLVRLYAHFPESLTDSQLAGLASTVGEAAAEVLDRQSPSKEQCALVCEAVRVVSALGAAEAGASGAGGAAGSAPQRTGKPCAVLPSGRLPRQAGPAATPSTSVQVSDSQGEAGAAERCRGDDAPGPSSLGGAAILDSVFRLRGSLEAAGGQKAPDDPRGELLALLNKLDRGD